MPVENVVVRPHRRLVEKYAEPGTWETLDVGEASELALNVAGLPNSLDPEAEETKRFDLLLLRLQLALLRTEPAFPRLQQQVQGIAYLLERGRPRRAVPGRHCRFTGRLPRPDQPQR